MTKAIAACHKHKARLVIARLDRLARDVEFIAGLIKQVDFVCCDRPHAKPFELHIYAALAQEERRLVSERTKAALAAAFAKGKRLGNYERIAAAKQRATTARAEAVRPAISETAHLSARAAAGELNRREVRTASGKLWHTMQILRLSDRLGLRP